MSLVLIKSVIVQLLVLSAKGATVPNVTDEVILDITSTDKNFVANENVKLHLKATVNPEDRILPGACTMTCQINGTIEISASKCEVLAGNDQTLYIDAVTNRNITSKDNGTWVCTFVVRHKSVGTDGNTTTGSIPRLFSFQLHVKIENTPLIQDWIMFAIGGGILVLLIIIGQTICIIHFKKQAKVVRRQAEWTSKRGSSEDVVRYSKMPVQKVKVEPSLETRESGIYEALDHVRAVPAPLPPPLKTLPRKDASHNSTPVPIEPPAETTATRTFTNGMLLPFTNSLLRNKNKKMKQLKESDSNRSSTDRIKERPPLPLPSDELYEVMENSPTPPKKEFKKTETQKKEVFRGFNTTARPLPAPTQAIFGSGAQTLQSQVIPSQLKEELRKRVNTCLLEPSRQKQPQKITPFNPSPPAKQAPAISFNPVPPPAKQAPPISRPERNTPTPVAKKPPPVPVGPKPTPVALGPKPTPVPVGPKPSTPAPMVSRATYKPPPPVKPKQLHPLPPTPHCRPESIHVITEGGGDDSDEDWTYEPLPNYPIYSI